MDLNSISESSQLDVDQETKDLIKLLGVSHLPLSRTDLTLDTAYQGAVG